MSAGAASTVATNPLWVVKTRFMTQEVGPNEPRYKHTFDAISRMYHNEGIKTFYRGLLPSLFGITHIALQFPLYEQFKAYNKPADGSDIPAPTILICSSVSKMIASVATYPHEVLRTRLQVQKHAAQEAAEQAGKGKGQAKFEGVVATFKRILRTEGYKGFYRGMGVNLLRTVPASALTILSYEVAMKHLLALSGGKGKDN